MYLDSTLKSVEIILAGAVTTNQLTWTVDYVDVSQTTFGVVALSEGDGVTNNTTAVTVVAAPGASITRKVQFMSVVNADTVAATVTIRINDNGTFRNIIKVTLASGDNLQYVG